jgi:hypothetical protein
MPGAIRFLILRKAKTFQKLKLRTKAFPSIPEANRMKRGFLKNATKAALKEPESNALDTIRDPRRPTITTISLTAESREVGGLNRAPGTTLTNLNW